MPNLEIALLLKQLGYRLSASLMAADAGVGK